MEKIKMSEAQLCAKIIEYFEGFDIYPEVPVPMSGRICDIVMLQGAMCVAIEVKMCFNLTVLYQAITNMEHAHFSYIAIPEPKSYNNEGIELCRKLGIGLLYYSPQAKFIVNAMYKYWRHNKPTYSSHIKEVVKPNYCRPVKQFVVKDWMKRNVAGSQHERLTDFKILMEEIAEAIQKAGGKVLAKDFFSKNHYHYASTQSARYSIKKLCETGRIKDFDYIDGYLTVKAAN